MTAATLADTIFFVVFFILISLNDGKKLFCKDVAKKWRLSRHSADDVNASMFRVCLNRKIYQIKKTIRIMILVC
jgi:hypothetical protein